MPDDNNVGLSGYQASQGSRSARQVLARLLEKSRLRAALSAIEAELNATLPTLNAVELQELQSLMACEIAAADDDVEVMRNQVAEESKLAKTTRTVQVTLPRRAVAALAAESERCVSRGAYPNVESLVMTAIERAYGGRP